MTLYSSRQPRFLPSFLGWLSAGTAQVRRSDYHCSSEPQPLLPSLLHPFLTTISALIKGGTTSTKTDVAVQCLEALLSRPECRKAVWEIPDIITGYGHFQSCNCIILTRRLSSFVQILQASPSPQMSYQVAFCLWLLSFEQQVAEQINKCVLEASRTTCTYTLHRKYDVIPLLIDIAQGAVKEKVIRVIVATFRVGTFRNFPAPIRRLTLA